MKQAFRIIIALILGLIPLLVLIPAQASDITHANYTGNISISNTGTSTTNNIFTTCEINTTALMNGGYFRFLGDANNDGVINAADRTAILQMVLAIIAITPNADATNNGVVDAADAERTGQMYDPFNYGDGTLNWNPYDLIATSIQSNLGADVAYMPAIAGSTTWSIHVPTAATGSTAYHLYTGGNSGNTSMQSKIRYFPGVGGMTMAASANMSLGATWEVEIAGYFNSSVAAYYILNTSGGASTFSINSLTPNAIQVVSNAIGAPGYLLATEVNPGDHILKIVDSGANATLYIDGTPKDTKACGTVDVAAASWTYFTNGTMPYVQYVKITPGGVLQQYITWRNSATFADWSGNGHDTTPSFRTSSSSAFVTASFNAFTPKTPAQLPSIPSTSSGSSFFSTNAEMPTQMFSIATTADYSKLPGGDIANALLDASGTPRLAWWYPFVFIGIAIIGMLTYEATTMMVDGSMGQHRLRMISGAKDGSLLAMCIVIEACLVVVGTMGATAASSIIPFWPAVLFLIPTLTVISAQWGVKT